jgi:hypothetical protein
MSEPLVVGRWSIHRELVLRMAGFPLAWLDSLACVAASDSARRFVALELTHTAAVASLDAALAGIDWRTLSSEDAARLGRARRAAARGEVDVGAATGLVQDDVLVNAAGGYAELPAANLAAEKAFAEDLAKACASLRAYAARDRVQEAIGSLSPQALTNALRGLLADNGPRTSKMRERERVVTTYLQRLCAKNETNAFFGPTAAGRLENVDGLRCPVASPIRGSRVYVAHWAAQALADAALRELPALDCPEASPTLRCEGEIASFSTNEQLPGGRVRRRHLKARLGAVELAGIAAADGTRTRTEVVAAAAVDGRSAEIAGLVDEMIDAGMLRPGLRIPSGHLDPLGWVIDAVTARDATAPCRDRLLELRALLTEYANAPYPARRDLLARIETRFAELTDGPTRRNGGKHYADRAIVSEECAGGGAVSLDERAFKAAGAGFDRLFDLVALPVLAWRAAVRAWHKQTFSQPAPFLEVERRLLLELDAIGALRSSTGAAQSVARARAIIARAIAGGGARVEIPLEALTDAIDPAHLVDGLACHHSIDVLPFREGGALRLLMGEVHPLFWIQDVLHAHLPEGAALAAGRQRVVRELLDGRKGAEVVFSHGSKVDFRSPTGLDYELVVDGAGLAPREQLLRIADVDVVLDGDVFRFSTPAAGAFEPVAMGALPLAFQLLPSIYPGSDRDGGYFPAELLPAEPPARIPRLELGGLVLRRQTWSLPIAELRALRGASSLVDARRLQHRYDLPERMFYKAPAEPKPVFLDLRSPHLIEVMAHQLRDAEGTALLTLSEMLPDDGELALEGPDGMRTCELRMAAWRRTDGR